MSAAGCHCFDPQFEAINPEMTKSESLVPQDMQECRVSQHLTFMKYAHVSGTVTEENHNGNICLFRSSFEAQQFLKIEFPQTSMVITEKLAHLLKNKMPRSMGHLSRTRLR